MKKAKQRSEALGVAIHMECEGIEFYSKCVERVTHVLTRKMFHSLMEDEKRHAEIFEAMAREEGVVPAAVKELKRNGALRRMAKVFRAAGKHLKKSLKRDAADIKAIEIALKMETKSFIFYNETAKTVKDAKEKNILLRIAAEENEHFRILNDTKMYLTYPEMWSIIDEKPVIDGG